MKKSLLLLVSFFVACTMQAQQNELLYGVYTGSGTLKGMGTLKAETYDVANQNLWQYSQEAVSKDLEEAGTSEGTCGEIVLIADIIHTKQHSRYQSDNHYTHNTRRQVGRGDVFRTLYHY